MAYEEHLDFTQPQQNHEPFCTIKQAAEKLGIPYSRLLRAVRRGLAPSYSFGNSRELVRISEVVTAIKAARVGEKSNG